MNFPQIAQQVIDKLGGKENIATAAHCATRLRIVLNDESKVDKEGIDNILPYLSKSQRTELADYVEMKAEPAVLSTFGDSVRIERMTNNYLLLKANEATRLEIKLLDNSTLALVQTWMAPAAESKLSLFNLQWQPKEVVVDYKANIVKPESMSDDDFADLKTLMFPRLKEYRLSPDNNSLSVSWNYPLLSKKDVKRVTEILKSQVLNWTGKDFR